MIIFAGTAADRSLLRLGLFYVALTTASALGASGLYAMVRRGGRPLVERFLEVHIPHSPGPMRPGLCRGLRIQSSFRIHPEFTRNSLRIHRQLIQITVV